MSDIEQQLRDGLRDEQWSLAPHPDPRDAIAAIAAKRRRAQGVGVVAGAAALVAAAVVVPQLVNSPDSSSPIATGPTTSSPATSDPTVAPGSNPPVMLREIGFELAPGQTFDIYTDQIRFDVTFAMCDPVLPGDIVPQTSYAPGEFRIALYAVQREPSVVRSFCAGRFATMTYTLDLLGPIIHRDIVLDHEPPQNPANAQPVPRDAVPADYVDSSNPDLAQWTSHDPVLSMWFRGVADECDPPVGYISFLFPTDGVANFEPDPDANGLVDLPDKAIDTGWRAGPVAVFVEPDYSKAYFVVNGRAELWTRARDCVGASFPGRAG